MSAADEAEPLADAALADTPLVRLPSDRPETPTRSAEEIAAELESLLPEVTSGNDDGEEGTGRGRNRNRRNGQRDGNGQRDAGQRDAGQRDSGQRDAGQRDPGQRDAGNGTERDAVGVYYAGVEACHRAWQSSGTDYYEVTAAKRPTVLSGKIVETSTIRWLPLAAGVSIGNP